MITQLKHDEGLFVPYQDYAQRVKELESELRTTKENLQRVLRDPDAVWHNLVVAGDLHEQRIAELESDNQRLREALEPYAQHENWRNSDFHLYHNVFQETDDGWEIASDALAAYRLDVGAE
jgi:hypothetical protein